MDAALPSLSLTEPHPWVAAGQHRIRFGVFGGPQLDQPPDWGRLIALVQAAENLGFDSYWTADHPALWADCWATLMPLAARTRTIRLGPLVNCIYYRSPALTARLAADIDQISQGRLVVGIGMGDATWEFAQLGLPFPPVRDRQAALEEALTIITGLWSGQPVTVEGAHFQVRAAVLRSGPVQQPRIPILIAGGGERVTLRQVAQFADASNFGAHANVGSAFTPEDVRRKLAALDAHCATLGRPADTVLRSHWSCPVVVAETPEGLQAKLTALGGIAQNFQTSMVAGLPHEVAAAYRGLADAGLQYFIAAVFGDDVETLRLLAEQVLPALASA
jgi:alkanesulfonate monooxygenase SsuD/methylene tetrahydromethanopterin reductase-like flavin-dependent oxidoreductase (luciferase family)